MRLTVYNKSYFSMCTVTLYISYFFPTLPPPPSLFHNILVGGTPGAIYYRNAKVLGEEGVGGSKGGLQANTKPAVPVQQAGGVSVRYKILPHCDKHRHLESNVCAGFLLGF